MDEGLTIVSDSNEIIGANKLDHICSNVYQLCSSQILHERPTFRSEKTLLIWL